MSSDSVGKCSVYHGNTEARAYLGDRDRWVARGDIREAVVLLGEAVLMVNDEKLKLYLNAAVALAEKVDSKLRKEMEEQCAG